MTENLPVWSLILGGLAVLGGPGGAAWVAVKVALNGTVKRVERLEMTADGIQKDVAYMRERLSRMEGRHEQVAE